MDPVPMLVISGPPGVGKTTVAWEVFSRAAERDEAPAMADLDLLGAAWPAPQDDPFQHRLKARNLAAVWSSFRETGSRCLIVAAVIETNAELDMLQSAVGAHVFLCRLKASDHTLADRIRHRGREFGDDLPKLVKRSAEVSALLASGDVGDLVVDTDRRQVGEVANTLLAAWRHSPAALGAPKPAPADHSAGLRSRPSRLALAAAPKIAHAGRTLSDDAHAAGTELMRAM